MGKNLLFSALGIGRATVLCNNAGLANPFKAGRSQGVYAAGTAKGCSHPPLFMLTSKFSILKIVYF